METTAEVEVAPAAETKDASGASKQQARGLSVQPEAEEAVGAGSEVEDAQQMSGTDDEPAEGAEPVKEGDASEVAVVVGDMVAGVVVAGEQELVVAAQNDSSPVASMADEAEESVEAAEPVAEGGDGPNDSPAEVLEVVESGGSVDTPTEEVATSASEEVRVSVTSIEEAATETAEVEAAATESATTAATTTEEGAIEKATTEVAISVGSVTKETVTQTATSEEAATVNVVSETTSGEEAAIETAATKEAVSADAVADEPVAEEAVSEAVVNEEAARSAAVTEQIATATATSEEVVTENAAIEEVAIKTAVTEITSTDEIVSEAPSVETLETENTAVVAEAAPVMQDDPLSREVAEGIVNAVVDGIIAKAIARVDEALLAKSLAFHAVFEPAQAIEEATIIGTEVTAEVDPAEAVADAVASISQPTKESRDAVVEPVEEVPHLEEIAASADEQSAASLEDTVTASSDSIAVNAALSVTETAKDKTEERLEAAAEENTAEQASVAIESEVDKTEVVVIAAVAAEKASVPLEEAASESEKDTTGNDTTTATAADSEAIEDKTEAFAAESVAVESATEDVAASASVGSVESVTIETKPSDVTDQPTQSVELATIPLTVEPKDSQNVPSSSRSVSSDEEGWRSDDNDSVDGGDASTMKKKSRKFRSPVRSMISRFANKVSSSMPKKLGAHRTESAAKLDLVTPSPVKGTVSHLETHRKAKPETHRTESAAKLDLEGNSPVKHIVHRFESPQHNSLDNLKIRTVRTFFDEKERSIHVNQEKEKYDSALKPVAEGEATPKKLSPTSVTAARPSLKAADDATSASTMTPASPAPVKKSSEETVDGTATIDTTTVTPVKNMVSRFEKKPEQSLDNLSFRTVRTFFPTIEEPSIRVGAEKQKYEAVTEQQRAEVRRLEEEKLVKKKAAESAPTEAETIAGPVDSEEEHMLRVRDIAHQLEARSSLTRDLAPASLSRSSSGTSDCVDTTPTRLARSTSNTGDRSSVGGAALPPPSLSRSASASSDRPPRFVARSQSDASSHNGETASTPRAGDEFHVKDVAQRFESRLTSSSHNASARVHRSSGAEVTLGAAHSQLRRASEPPAKQPFVAPVVVTSNEEKSKEEVFHVKAIAHRFEAKQQSPVTRNLSRQSSGVETVITLTSTTAATPPRFRLNSSQGSATNTPATSVNNSTTPATPTQVQVASNAVIETTPAANVKDIAHRFETNRMQSVETPAYRTVETFFKEVDEPSIRVRAEKAKLEALEKQKEQEAKLAWAKTLHAEEEAAAAARKTETLHWFLMPATANPAFVRLHAVLADRDPVTALAMFPRQEQANAGADSDLTVPLIPMDLPPFA